jgi:hypothetical protein
MFHQALADPWFAKGVDMDALFFGAIAGQMLSCQPYGVQRNPGRGTAVQESNVFNRFELSSSEKQIPRFVGNVSS